MDNAVVESIDESDQTFRWSMLKNEREVKGTKNSPIEVSL